MNKILAVLIAISLSSCGWLTKKEIVYVPKKVYVTVAAECPVPPEFIRKPYPADNLTSADKGNYQKIAESYALSIKMLKKDLDDLNSYLDVYRNQEATSKEEFDNANVQ
jgi:hypothetical protein